LTEQRQVAGEVVADPGILGQERHETLVAPDAVLDATDDGMGVCQEPEQIDIVRILRERFLGDTHLKSGARQFERARMVAVHPVMVGGDRWTVTARNLGGTHGSERVP